MTTEKNRLEGKIDELQQQSKRRTKWADEKKLKI